MQFGAAGDAKTDVQVVLEALQLGPGVFQYRELGESGIASGNDGGPEPVCLGLGMLYQEAVVGHCGQDGVAGRLVKIESAGHLGQAKRLRRVGHQQVKNGQGAGRGLGK